ncbi:siderophore synthetase component [Herbaspirillum sp. CF444]|uniref:IucA/IucC family protein n=1 Tax=Herbaspirillum sp. CF444 TaxID=1144319 RepID=UPI0002725E21|nr:IucA/IucC family protein [Herbaspirillum sp. CF444]EJL82860.1 siderophore synthetase component [Herbaspirillum sp. CF444]
MSPSSYQNLIVSPAYRQASRRVLRQLLEALLFEHALADVDIRNGELQLNGRDHQGAGIAYRCTVRSTFSFARIRVLSPLMRTGADGSVAEAGDPALFLTEIAALLNADPLRLQQFAAELLATQIKDAQTLHARSGGSVLRGAPYDRLEARLTDSHPYHPSYKSRLGFTLTDNAAYSPEIAEAVRPLLIAVLRTRARAAFGNGIAAAGESKYLLHEADYRQFCAELERRGASPDDYLPLPVHPWQWDEIIAPGYHQALAGGELHLLGQLQEQYLPQQSIRTLGSMGAPQRPSLKLAMNLVNTSTSRVLAPHTVQNAAPISDWLQDLVRATDWPQPMKQPVILREIAGVSYTQQAPAAAQYGALSCIWRESIHQHLTPPEQAAPMTALLHIDGDGRPYIEPWIALHGPAHWLQTLIERAWLPVLHLLWTHGAALESHAQNMLLLHVDGLPERVALKDFHDGVRFSPALLSGPPPTLTAPPAEHARVNPNSFIQTDDANELRDFTFDALFFVNLAELAWLFERCYDFPQTRFWDIVADVLRRHQQAHPQQAARYALFDCFAPQVDIELLASRRFQPEIRLRTRAAPNPLAQAGRSRESAA